MSLELYNTKVSVARAWILSLELTEIITEKNSVQYSQPIVSVYPCVD